MKNKSFSVHICAIIAMIFWGFSYIWSTQVFKSLNPTTTICFRLIISSIFLSIILTLFNKFEKIEKKHIKLFAISALFEPFLYFLFESYGLLYASPIISSTIIATIPLFAPVIAFFILKEKITKWNIVGFAASFVGVIIMLINKGLDTSSSTKGIVLLFLAVMVALCYNVALKKLTSLYKPLTITTVQNIIGAIYFIPAVIIVEHSQPSTFMPVGSYIMPLIMLGIFASSLAYTLWAYSFSKLGSAKTNVYSNLIPVFTAIFSYLVLRESVTWQKILGIVFVVGGLILSQLKSKTYDNKQNEQ